MRPSHVCFVCPVMNEGNKPRSVLNGLDGLLFLLSFIHVFQRFAFVLKLCFTVDSFPITETLQNDLTQSSLHPPSLSLKQLRNTRPEWKPTKVWGGELNFAKMFHIICLLNQHAWEIKWQNDKLRQQGGELLWWRLISYSEPYLFILKSAPLCQVSGCGGGRALAPAPWPPAWSLLLKTFPET